MISQAIEWIGAHTAVVRLGVRQPSLGTQLRPRAVRIEHSDGTRLKVLSACHW